MSYKCIKCGMNDVEHQGGVCELCAIGQDPYAAEIQKNSSVQSNGFQRKILPQQEPVTDNNRPVKTRSRKVLLGNGSQIANTDPYGNQIDVTDSDDSVQVYQPGQVPSTVTSSSTGNANISVNTPDKAAAGPITEGIVKNITVDVQSNSPFRKLLRTLFQGVPYTLDNDITLFQVFPDYSGTALNAQGNACDQVIIYGKLNAGAVSENNDIEVYGRRDAKFNIVAKKIVNKATGTTVTPYRVVPVWVIWLITVIAFVFISSFIAVYGIVGVFWAVIIAICLTNLPLVFKLISIILGIIISVLRRVA